MPIHKDGNSSCHGAGQADQHAKKPASSRIRRGNSSASTSRGSSLKELSIKDKLFRLKKVDIHQDNDSDESHFKVCGTYVKSLFLIFQRFIQE